ncbi:uncharacterized protein LOC125759489 [Rhipicephalus sanguineus]|uniref:uncharacterized protein LOC125759489 n=1 Tax=Rhipicephalus sanguineus TaxID=34632 RepID=UPI0020C3D3DB|nr:uncharacterized protein LOC125759489 [Rhipicephalus sanguineus]
MQFTNPFLFIVQVSLGLLLITTGTSLTPDAPTQWPRHRCSASGNLIPHLPTLDQRFKGVVHISGTLPEPGCASPTTSRFDPINQGADGTFGSGHGSCIKTQFTNPFLFIVQVRKDYGKSFRSNNTCLLLLPCPRPLVDVLLFIRFSLRFLLLLGGDVESNPGPGDSVLADQLKAIADYIREIKAEKSITNHKLSAIDRKLGKLTGLEKQVSACTKRVVELEKNLAAMTKKIDELENRSRRSNIIVYGIQEEPNETTETLLRTTKERVLEGLLGLDITGIERIHGLGKLVKENPTKSRPVILKLLDYRDKVSILKECFKLKGSGFSISEDYSHAVRDVRKKLWNRTKENRDRKEKVMLTYDKVRINGRLFAWDEERNDIVEMKTKNATPLAEPRVTRSKK